MKMIKIGIILMVLLSMVGFASASASMAIGPSLDLDTNGGGSVTWDVAVTVSGTTPNNGLVSQTLNFDNLHADVTGVLVGADSVSNALITSSTPMGGTTGAITWHPTLPGTYYFKYTVTVSNTPALTSYGLELFTIGVSTTSLNPSANVNVSVPEFPTIALPVAAILGLAFIFQRRKEED